MKVQSLILLIFFCLVGNIFFGQQFSYDNNAGLFPKKNKKHKYGYVNQNGKQIIKYQFDYAETFSEGFAAVVIDGKFDFIDQSGNFITTQKFDIAWNFSQCFALVKKNGKYAYVDTLGKILKDKWFDQAAQMFDNYAEARISNTNFLISNQGQVMNYGNNKMPRKQTGIFKLVQQIPNFPGGSSARNNFIDDFLKSQNQLNKNSKKFINVSFVVERDGTLAEIKIANPSNDKFDAIAIKLVKSMPIWIPGKQRGTPVRVLYNLPILINKKYE